MTRYGFGMGNYGWFFEQWQGKMEANTMWMATMAAGQTPTARWVLMSPAARKPYFSVWKRLIDDGVITYLGRGNNDAVRLYLRQHRHHPGIHQLCPQFPPHQCGRQL